MATINDFFNGLLEFSFRGVSFPSTDFRVGLRHDLAKHAYPGRDGAQMEATGMAPLEFSANIPFYNHIAAGKGENWPSGALYPGVYRKFIMACADKTTGELQHPEFGKINVKTESCESHWDATKRGGVTVSVTWIETLVDEKCPKSFSNPSAGASAISAAVDLDTMVTQIDKTTIPKLAGYKPTFADSIRSLQAVADQTGIVARRVAGRVDKVIYAIGTLEDAIKGAASAYYWPVRQNIERLKDALRTLERERQSVSRTTRVYVPAQSATLAAISLEIPAPLSDLMRLNKPLLTRAIVPAQSRVFYFAA
jgi:prophage DNA circulation protein